MKDLNFNIKENVLWKTVWKTISFPQFINSMWNNFIKIYLSTKN